MKKSLSQPNLVTVTTMNQSASLVKNILVRRKSCAAEMVQSPSSGIMNVGKSAVIAASTALTSAMLSMHPFLPEQLEYMATKVSIDQIVECLGNPYMSTQEDLAACLLEQPAETCYFNPIDLRTLMKEEKKAEDEVEDEVEDKK
jgi:hypothetical protein